MGEQYSCLLSPLKAEFKMPGLGETPSLPGKGWPTSKKGLNKGSIV